MNVLRISLLSRSKWVGASFLLIGFLFAAAQVSYAQREYTVVKPRERAADERVIIRTVVTEPANGVLVVVLDPVIAGKVVVEDLSGKLLGEAQADETGQAEFQLRRGRAYRVKATAPGYIGAEGQSKLLRANDTVRLKLTPQFATLTLRNIPAGARVLIDGKEHVAATRGGIETIADLTPGSHTLLVLHPEYNDFRSELANLEAGDQITFLVALERVAKLTVQGPPGAAVLIDGERRGEIQASGSVTINYPLAETSEHTITVEKLGFQTWSSRQQLKPGARTLAVTLEPIITSAGVSDAFDDLSLWSSPPEWQIRRDRLPNGRTNGRLVVSGEQLGTPQRTLYRDFDVNFTIWLPGGRGASWAVRVDNTGRNYYLFHLAGPRSETPNKFYTYLVRDGQLSQVSTPFPVLADLNQKDSYTIDLAVRGHNIRHWITSNTTGERNDLGSYTDTTGTKEKFLYGTFGFRSLKGETFLVDDFSIQPVKEADKISRLQ